MSLEMPRLSRRMRKTRHIVPCFSPGGHQKNELTQPEWNALSSPGPFCLEYGQHSVSFGCLCESQEMTHYLPKNHFLIFFNLLPASLVNNPNEFLLGSAFYFHGCFFFLPFIPALCVWCGFTLDKTSDLDLIGSKGKTASSSHTGNREVHASLLPRCDNVI